MTKFYGKAHRAFQDAGGVISKAEYRKEYWRGLD
jgi:hypothetical protein